MRIQVGHSISSNLVRFVWQCSRWNPEHWHPGSASVSFSPRCRTPEILCAETLRCPVLHVEVLPRTSIFFGRKGNGNTLAHDRVQTTTCETSAQ